ncbi:hypothetical protein [Desulfotomaculum sp. 1211_IL3151]|uniref:hypothetical protein n=1 Tax=Desulfotomaculum sp. 1211_IL3151 TaxID=3084055 RepID=UPI002FD9B997
MEKITPSYSLPDKDVTFEAYKFESLDRFIMRSATGWAEAKESRFGDEQRAEASAYLLALTLILAGTMPEDEYNGICNEYWSMIRGKRPSREVSHANKDQR